MYSKCSSLHEITTVLRGNYGGTPLPDILSSSKLMKPMDFGELDYQAAFKGTSTLATPEDIGTRDKKLPINLCLTQYYTTSRKNRPARRVYSYSSSSLRSTSRATISIPRILSQILEIIAKGLGCYQFQGASLFIYAKNTKLESMEVDSGLNTAYEG
ncbi:hypothetical protein BGZ57DRAFT_1008082 [Hyaloscypha finlandica]|nr:hypothetical protein BGZ57DRAFT_1008082 [Hyaloscypha finlandica]